MQWMNVLSSRSVMAKSIETREMHWLQNQRDWTHTMALSIQLTLDQSTISGSRMCRRHSGSWSHSRYIIFGERVR